VLGELYRRLLQTAFRVRVRDPKCAFRLIRRDLVQSLQLRCGSDLVVAELFDAVTRTGAAIGEVGVRHRAREAGVSKAVSTAALLRLARDMLRYYVS
jgi:hypothetical protein